MNIKEDNSIFNTATSVGSAEDSKSSNAAKGKNKYEAQEEEPEQMVSD